MLKYITLLLFGLLVANIIYTYVKTVQYKEEIVKRNEIIVNVTKKNVELTEEINKLNDSIKRYKYNIGVYAKDNANLKIILKDYELRIKDLTQKYSQTKDTLEKTIKEYQQKIDNMKIDNVTFVDNVTENVTKINSIIDGIVNGEAK